MESILKRTGLTLLIATAFASTAAFAAPSNHGRDNSRNAAPAAHRAAPQPQRQAQTPHRAAPAPQRQAQHRAAPAPQRQVQHRAAPAQQRQVQRRVTPAPQRQIQHRAAPAPQRQVIHRAAPAPQHHVVHRPAPVSHHYTRISHDRHYTWRVGRPLPRTVVYHDAPVEYVQYLPVAPYGHRYVQIGSDIVLLAIGTGIIIDALTGFY
ncbi:MAG: RcnB family protein [Azoarcus sp.]|nr:RcnB family protein [Azoarcus sp.]